MNISLSRIASTPLEQFIVDDKLGGPEFACQILFLLPNFYLFRLGVGYGKRPLKKIVRPNFIRKVLSSDTAFKDYMKTPINFAKVFFL